MARQSISKPLRARPQRLVLFLGLLLGAVAAGVVVYAINQGGGTGGGDGSRAVVVAAQDIPADTRLTAEMLAVSYLPADEADPEAFTARSQVVDRVVTQDVKAGQQLLPSVVSAQEVRGLAAILDPGTRALSISVGEVITAGGNARPGDRVDVLGIFEVQTEEAVRSVLATFAPYALDQKLPTCPQEGEGTATEGTGPEGTEGSTPGCAVYQVTVTLVQDTRLLALSQTLATSSATQEGSEEAPAEEETAPEAATATLQVTPEQAQQLALASQFGALRLTVRPFGEESVIEYPVLITLIDGSLSTR